MLPSYLTTFIGGEPAIEQVSHLLARHRVVTVTGAGGCGKTRLAVETVSRFGGDIRFVDLAPLSRPGLVVNAVASALDVGEPGAKPIRDALPETVGERELLVVLDNCEHVVTDAADVAELLVTRCSGVRVLATSREPLRVPGEVTWRVRSLSLPDAAGSATIEELERSTAVQLFVDRARLARPGYALTVNEAEAVRTICRRLDGIPLALELAASRMGSLDAQQLAAGLKDRFALLGAGPRTVPTRQQTLEASVAWSYDLLDEVQRLLLRRLSVFAGRFTTDEVVDVCGGDGLADADVVVRLAELVDRSLVHVDHEVDGSHYRLLETIRSFALQRLREAGEDRVRRERHLAYLTAVCERFDAVSDTSGVEDAAARLERHLDDVRQAIEWCLETDRWNEGLRLASDLRLFWIVRNRTQEGRSWLDRLLAGPTVDAVRARGLAAAAQLALYAIDPFRQRELADEAIEVARRVGDRKREGRALVLAGWARAFVDASSALDVLDEARRVVQVTGDEPFEEFAELGAGIAAVTGPGDLLAARRSFDLAIAINQRLNTFGLRFALAARGYVETMLGELTTAERTLRQALDLPIGAFEFNRELATQWLGLALTYRGQYDTARSLLTEALESARRIGNAPVFTLAHLGLLDLACGDHVAARHHAGEALAVFELLRLGWLATMTRRIVADAAALAGDEPAAIAGWRDALTVAESSGNRLALTVAGVGASRAALVEGDEELARTHARRALRHAVAVSYAIGAVDALEQLAHIAAASGEQEDAARLAGFVDAHRCRLGYARFPIDQPAWARLRDAVAGAGSAPATSGAALSFEEAVAEATRGSRPARPPTGWASLTPAELRVARLVAEGLTNRQIGERLFVSPRTVQTHIVHLFAKLGVANRAELAAAASRAESVRTG